MTAPQNNGYQFSPSSRSYQNVTANVTGANFTAQALPPSPPPPTTTWPFNKTINYSYNNVGALAGVGTNLWGSDPNNTTNVLNTTTFRANGAIKSLIYGNGRQLTMGYNANRQQPVSLKVDRVGNAADKLIDYSYEYYTAEGYNNNRIRKIIDNLDGNYMANYQYDEYNRLTTATANAYTRGYGYDGFGNLRTVSGTNGLHASYTLNYALNGTNAPATNRIASVTENGVTEPFSYDAAGNLTAGDGQTYTYDGASRLSSVNGGALGQYGYDGDGMRVKKVEGGQTIFYVQSKLIGAVAMEVTSAGVQRASVLFNRGVLAELSVDGNFYWIHRNHVGSSTKLTDSAGVLRTRTEHDPHGQLLLDWSNGAPNLSNRKFGSYERDASGLDYANARTYTGNRGRFMQLDPVVSISRPQSWNRYSYVRNDSINFIDPSGRNGNATNICNVPGNICASVMVSAGPPEPVQTSGRIQKFLPRFEEIFLSFIFLSALSYSKGKWGKGKLGSRVENFRGVPLVREVDRYSEAEEVKMYLRYR